MFEGLMSLKREESVCHADMKTKQKCGSPVQVANVVNGLDPFHALRPHSKGRHNAEATPGNIRLSQHRQILAQQLHDDVVKTICVHCQLQGSACDLKSQRKSFLIKEKMRIKRQTDHERHVRRAVQFDHHSLLDDQSIPIVHSLASLESETASRGLKCFGKII
jgi:hypothetical protein